MPESVLSVFCDESGDFGEFEPHAPYYIVTLVFHDQRQPIGRQVDDLSRRLSECGQPGSEPVHTAPLIRREPPYSLLGMPDRRKVFGCIMGFMRACPISVKSFVISKRDFGGGRSLAERLARELGMFLRDSIAWLHSFDRVVVYYDRGQRQVESTLRLIFSSILAGVEFRTVSPSDYRLFQVADLACTLELLATKQGKGMLSRSELAFFGSERSLRRNYLRPLEKIRR